SVICWSMHFHWRWFTCHVMRSRLKFLVVAQLLRCFIFVPVTMALESLAFTTASQVTRPSVPAPVIGAAQLNAPAAPYSTTGALSAGAVAGVAALALGSRSNRRTTNVSRAAVATIGQKVSWKGNPGTVKFSGPVDFASGEWVGIELDAPNGMHDGSVFNKSYFTCTPKHGVFCQPADIGAGAAAPAAPAAAAPMAAAPAVATPAAAPAGGSVAVGQKVSWKGQSGTVQYVGKVGFAAGEWVGVQLDTPTGMHDGSVFNVPYFSCPPKTGIFCTPAEVGAGGAPAAPATPAAAPVAAPMGGLPAAAPAGGSFSVGSRVMWNGNAGTVQYVGTVGFATGEWVGVALDQPAGMHDGSLFGEEYFSCTAKHGVFSQAAALQAA
ncbi:CAP-Gly domain, partial [Amphidinium carterae]